MLQDLRACCRQAPVDLQVKYDELVQPTAQSCQSDESDCDTKLPIRPKPNYLRYTLMLEKQKKKLEVTVFRCRSLCIRVELFSNFSLFMYCASCPVPKFVMLGGECSLVTCKAEIEDLKCSKSLSSGESRSPSSPNHYDSCELDILRFSGGGYNAFHIVLVALVRRFQGLVLLWIEKSYAFVADCLHAVLRCEIPGPESQAFGVLTCFGK